MEAVSDEVIAPVAAAIVCADQPIANTQIVRQTGLSSKLVSRAILWLIENDYVRRQDWVRGPTGHPRQPLAPTARLRAKCRTDRKWKRAVRLRQLCLHLELPADDVLDQALEALAEQCGLP